ncbi:MAG: lipid IV(A) 3-deoxy-D-manno-octulosonic acid transferase [Campylobacterales bacterium]|nr:lipid IV(A) 3-deoxy-D-manno-octulosonic acid transferase [Campylobacterales bacterium]
MLPFYYFLALLLYIVTLPFLLILSKKSKYIKSVPARFFLKNNSFFKKKCEIWFHGCSFGEIKSITPIIHAINKDVLISTITQTGFNEASKLSVDVKYLPFELFLPFWIKDGVKTLVVLEAELWYMLFFIAKKKGMKTILLNARISDKSYSRYKKFSFFYKKVFENIDIVFAQSEIDKARLLELGAKNIQVIGNIKLAQDIKITEHFKKSDKFTITLASSHEGEEELFLKALKNCDFKDKRVFIVPRHPERFEKVEKLCVEFCFKHSLSFEKFSERKEFLSDIILVDILGELINIYAITDMVILGGSFVKIGGHNPLEPAFFNTIIITGEYIFNQKSTFERVENYYIIKSSELDDVLSNSNIQKFKKSNVLEKIDLSPILKELS